MSSALQQIGSKAAKVLGLCREHYVKLRSLGLSMGPYRCRRLGAENLWILISSLLGFVEFMIVPWMQRLMAHRKLYRFEGNSATGVTLECCITDLTSEFLRA